MKAFRFEAKRVYRSQCWFESLYRHSLALYPPGFRAAHSEAMLQTLRDALRDPDASRLQLLLSLLIDLPHSVVREWHTMIQERFGQRIFVLYAGLLAATLTVLTLGICASVQSSLRQSANDPQIQMVRDAAALLEAGGSAESALPPGQVNAATSLSPFLIVYDDAGRPVASSASLDGRAPGPPAGVFEFARQHGEDWVTWQPRPGVRIASIVKRVRGTHPGFVLAGRSLEEVEARKGNLGNLFLLLWGAVMGLLVVSTGIFAWMTRPLQTSAAS
jgi:hypothetical protein